MSKVFKNQKPFQFRNKTIIISLCLFILTLLTLSTDIIMPNVSIAIIDALVITSTLFSAFVLIKFIYIQKIKALEKENLYQYNCMNTIFDNVNLTIFLEDKNGNILTANTGELNLIGLTPDDVIGKNTKEIFDLPKEYLAKKEEAIKTKTIVKYELRLTIRTETPHWLRIGIYPVLDEHNEVDKLIIIFLNIDKEHRLAEVKEDFVATLTHDLKTPTLAQLKTIDLLLKNTFGELNPEQREILKHIKDSCTYLNNLIFTILDSYMYENGNKKLIYDQINIWQFLQEVLNELEYLSKEKKQNIIINSNLMNENVVADRLQLKRVLINLVSNAVNHGLTGTDINISLSSDYNKFKFEIQNRSTYINEAKMAEMFNKYKLHSNNKYKNIGTGLGLYLSKNIINKHNGDIYAQSYQDGICVFGFEIPISQEKYSVEKVETAQNII